MTGSQYKNVTLWTLHNTPDMETADTAAAARTIFNNLGVAFPGGSCEDILLTLMSEDYMGWTPCTCSQAQEFANAGVAAVGVDTSRVVVILPDESADSVVGSIDAEASFPSVMQACDLPLAERLGMQFFAYAASSSTTTPSYITVNGWLRLCNRPSLSITGRTVNIPTNIIDPQHNKPLNNMYEWYAYEGLKSINYYASIFIEQAAGKKPEVNIGEYGELTDGEGRYWVAVGPNVVNPNHSSSQVPTASEMYGKGVLDVVLRDKNGKLWYFPAAVGDTKAHTYSNGIIQTWQNYSGDLVSHSYVNQLGAVEFIGSASTSGFNQYKLEKIIFYDGYYDR